jgi:hypothetical protein
VIDAGYPGRATDAGAGILAPETYAGDEPFWWDMVRRAGDHYPLLLERLDADGASTADAHYARCGLLSVGLRESEDSWFAPFADRSRPLRWERVRDHPCRGVWAFPTPRAGPPGAALSGRRPRRWARDGRRVAPLVGAAGCPLRIGLGHRRHRWHHYRACKGGAASRFTNSLRRGLLCPAYGATSDDRRPRDPAVRRSRRSRWGLERRSGRAPE